MKRTASTALMVIGAILTAIGLLMSTPGETLTTYSFYEDDASHTVIEEYVGGDAYNFIIGACIVGGKIAGMLAMKAVFIATGVLIFCLGIALRSFASDFETSQCNMTNPAQNSVCNNENKEETVYESSTDNKSVATNIQP